MAEVHPRAQARQAAVLAVLIIAEFEAEQFGLVQKLPVLTMVGQY